MSQADRRYPLDWPDGWPRTPRDARKHARFEVSFARARDDLLDELRLLGADDAIISTNVPLRLDGLPYATWKGREPEDPGVALHFRRDGRPVSMACDRYLSVGDNLRAIGLSVASLRALDRHGASGFLERAFAGFSALPAPDRIDWRAELGFKPNELVFTADVERSYRELARTRHPDQGGSDHAMARLNRAREAALKEIAEGRRG